MMQARRAPATRRRLLTAALSVAGHGVVLFLVLSARPPAGPPAEDPPMMVELAQLPPPPLPKTPKPRPEPEPPARPPPPRHVARPVKAPPPQAVPAPAGKGPAGESAEVSEGELASAATAGSGGGGAPCDMTQRLQTALRKDPHVQAAVAQAHHGRALMVWNGDWVRHEGQEGAGLAAVREAILWEVGFAPAACRTEPMRGLVAISMNDGPPASRLVMGSGAWRWSDMLKAHGSVRR